MPRPSPRCSSWYPPDVTSTAACGRHDQATSRTGAQVKREAWRIDCKAVAAQGSLVFAARRSAKARPSPAPAAWTAPCHEQCRRQRFAGHIGQGRPTRPGPVPAVQDRHDVVRRPGVEHTSHPARLGSARHQSALHRPARLQLVTGEQLVLELSSSGRRAGNARTCCRPRSRSCRGCRHPRRRRQQDQGHQEDEPPERRELQEQALQQPAESHSPRFRVPIRARRCRCSGVR